MRGYSTLANPDHQAHLDALDERGRCGCICRAALVLIESDESKRRDLSFGQVIVPLHLLSFGPPIRTLLAVSCKWSPSSCVQ